MVRRGRGRNIIKIFNSLLIKRKYEDGVGVIKYGLILGYGETDVDVSDERLYRAERRRLRAFERRRPDSLQDDDLIPAR